MTGTVTGASPLSRSSAWSWSWPGDARWLRGRLTTQLPIVVALARSRRSRSIQGIAGLAEDAEAPGYMGSPYVQARRSRRGLPISPSSASSRPTRRKPMSATSASSWRFLAGHLNRLPDMPQLLRAAGARRARLPCLAAGRGRGQPEPVAHAVGASHVLPLPRAARLRQERRDPRRGSAEAAAFGAEAAHRAQGDGAGRRRRHRFTRRSRNGSSARDTAVLALLYGSGLRISEALSLAAQGRADQRPRHAARHGQGRQDAGGAGAADRARGGRALSRALPDASSAPTIRCSSARAASSSARASSSSGSRGRAPRSGCRRRRRRMRSATPSPRICSAPAPICARSRSCSATRASRPRKAIPRSTASICSRPTTAPTPAPEPAPRHAA